MAVFGRRKAGAPREVRRRQTERDKLDATPPWETTHRDEPDPTTGPYDVADAPDDDRRRVDLGALRIPVDADVDIQADADAEGRIATVRLVRAGTQLQLGVFAAPRADGIWDEIREELAASMTAGGGRAAEYADGPFGTELRGELPGAGGAATPVRFVGVDGPRWFLRAMVVGPGAVDEAAATPLLDLVRGTVVVRGREPLPVREPVPLQLPRTPTDDGGADGIDGTDSGGNFDADGGGVA